MMRISTCTELIEDQFGKKVINFVDFDDQKYQLISDELNEGVKAGVPWKKGPVPLDYAITGLGPIHIRVSKIDYFKQVLEKVLGFTEIAQTGFFMNVPGKFLCSEDCKGLCPQCGADLNEGDCGCDNEVIDPRWEALKKIMDSNQD